VLRAGAPGFAGRIIYVALDGSGEGSRDAPFGQVDDALAAATDGDIIALAAGEYTAEARLGGVALVGGCVAAVRVVGDLRLSDGGRLARLTLVGRLTFAGDGSASEVAVRQGVEGVGVHVLGTANMEDVVVLDVSGAGGAPAGVLVEAGVLQGARLTIQRASNIGLHLGRAATAEVDGLVVADTQPIGQFPYRGRAVQVEGGSLAMLRSAVLVRNYNQAVVVADPGTVLTLEGALVSDTAPNRADGGEGIGVNVFLGGVVVLRRTQLLRNHSYGLAATEGEVELEQVLVADTLRAPGPSDFAADGQGVSVAVSSTLRVSQLAVVGNAQSGLALSGSQITGEDVLVAHTGPSRTGGYGRGIGIQEGSEASLSRVALIGNREAGLYVSGSDVDFTDLVVDKTLPEMESGEFGYGINAAGGATISLQRCRMSENRGSGAAFSDSGTTGVLQDCVISTTEPTETGNVGILVQQGAHLEIVNVAVVENQGAGVAVLGGGSELTGADVLVARTQPRDSDQLGGRGFEVGFGARVDLTRVELADLREVAVLVNGAGTGVAMRDVWVDGVGAGSDGTGGRGFAVQNGARLELRVARIDRSREVAIFADGMGATLDFEDLAIVDVLPDGQGEFGRGLAVQNGAAATIRRLAIVDCADSAIVVAGGGAVLDVADFVVHGTRAQRDGTFGRAVTVQNEARVSLVRGELWENRDVTIFVHGRGAHGTLTDVRVRDTAPQESDGFYGRGVVVQQFAELSATRVHIERNHQVGLLVAGGASAVVEDLFVAATMVSPCGDECAAGGVGVAVLGASLDLSHFAVQGSALAGLQLAEDVTLRATDGVISNNLIGLNVQDGSLDLAASFTRVHLRDNERDRDVTSYAVPDTAETLDSLRALQ
jgi:hypothetical protein